MLGRYIDALPTDALQRIRNAANWKTRGYADKSGARCLLGHAEDWYWSATLLQRRAGRVKSGGAEPTSAGLLLFADPGTQPAIKEPAAP